MKALIIIDAQNEFAPGGQRPVAGHEAVIRLIRERVAEYRAECLPIAWVRHFNKPHESPAFIPGSWGAEFYEGLGPDPRAKNEAEFKKDVYGAFTGSDIGEWLKSWQVRKVLIMGFYTFGCVSTTTREAIMADLTVYIEAGGTGACDIVHETLGRMEASEVKRTALLHLAAMGAIVSL